MGDFGTRIKVCDAPDSQGQVEKDVQGVVAELKASCLDFRINGLGALRNEAGLFSTILFFLPVCTTDLHVGFLN